jgi:tetratricopeptide (TPR) repeat protein
MPDLEDQALDLFEEVVGLGPEQRSALVQARCSGTPALLAKVEELLAYHREAVTKAFLESPLLPAGDYAALDGAGDEPRPDLPGYQTLRPIGAGGRGEVWLVRDLQLQREVAVKVMKAAGTPAPHRLHSFLREPCITARLAHPSIVPVHSMGRFADDQPYYTMKFVEGQTLEKLLKARPAIASDRTTLLQVFARVCQALAFAHGKGVIHGDANPRNVMVGQHGEVQVTDWGEARDLTESDDQPAGAVTWRYASPEQVSGCTAKIDRRSDVFGLGGILCAILTGKPPYVGCLKDVKRQARKADVAGAYSRLEACRADRELIDLARACLSPDPNDRPEDASVVEKRLTGYLASVEDRLRKAELARQRLRWLAVGLASTLLALVAAGRFAWLAEHEKLKSLAADRKAHLAELKSLAAERDRLAAKQAYEGEKCKRAMDTALTAAMGGDLDAAEQAITEAELAGASTAQVRMLRGQIALHRGQSQEAVRHLEQAVRLLPRSVTAWGMLAAAYASLGQWDWYDKAIREMKPLTPSTPEDFLFKGYAEANLEPTRGLQTINQAFDLHPRTGIALLLRSYVRAYVAQDTDDLKVAEGAVQDARYARDLLGDLPAALWVSGIAHLAKAGVHERRDETNQRRAELDLAGKDADALKPFTALPEAVVYRWLYFREMRREEEVLEELRLASERTHHVYVTFCYALTLYRRGGPGDVEKALGMLEEKHGTYNDRLLPFLLAERDYSNRLDWPEGARNAAKEFAATVQEVFAVMDTHAVLCLLGKKEEAVKASKELQKRPVPIDILRRETLLACLRYNAADLSEEEFIRGAKGSRYDQCLAHYYVAMTKLAAGDRKGAHEHFDKVIKTGAFLWGPYDMSWVFQARLAKDPTWPRWISKGRAK